VFTIQTHQIIKGKYIYKVVNEEGNTVKLLDESKSKFAINFKAELAKAEARDLPAELDALKQRITNLEDAKQVQP